LNDRIWDSIAPFWAILRSPDFGDQLQITEIRNSPLKDGEQGGGVLAGSKKILSFNSQAGGINSNILTSP
jgi:hypothetical protein